MLLTVERRDGTFRGELRQFGSYTPVLFKRVFMTDHRLQYPATLRNRDVILGVLRGILPASGVVLEIASGSGEHVVHFANALPGLTFQPSDPEPEAVRSIAAWIKDSGATQIRSPRILRA